MPRNLIGIEAVAHMTRRISCHDCEGCDIFPYHRTSSNDTPLANSDTLENDCTVADPNVVFHDSFDEVWPARESHGVARRVYRMVTTYECNVGCDEAVVSNRDVTRQMAMSSDIHVVSN
jgi:hypothetical protein